MKIKPNDSHTFLEKIKSNNNILIFHHINPDPDTIGFQYGLYNWIKENFPKKNVFLVKQNNVTFPNYFVKIFNEPFCSKNEFSKFTNDENQYLGIVGDTNVMNRVDGKNILEKFCNEYIIIDHHLFSKDNLKPWQNKELFYIIDSNFSSTCELLSYIFLKFKLENIFSLKTKKMLAYGIISDTGRFLHNSTTQSTFNLFNVFLKDNLSLQEIYTDLYKKDENMLKYYGYVLNNYIRYKNLIYCLVSDKILKKYNINFSNSKAPLFFFSNISSVDMYALFVEDIENNHWSGSLRSSTISVHDFAVMNNGGGHKYASGIKIASKTELNNLINRMKMYATNYKK